MRKLNNVTDTPIVNVLSIFIILIIYAILTTLKSGPMLIETEESYSKTKVRGQGNFELEKMKKACGMTKCTLFKHALGLNR